MVPLDGALAEHIFINLLENALRYTPAGSPISIAATRAGDHLEVEVADGGPGFSPEDLDKIFEMFYRGSTGQDLTGLRSGAVHLPGHRGGPRRADLGAEP